MMSHSARYERGLAKFMQMYGERAKTFLASLEGIAPDLGTYVMEFGFWGYSSPAWTEPAIPRDRHHRRAHRTGHLGAAASRAH